jgi:pilus assembly protein CpaC
MISANTTELRRLRRRLTTGKPAALAALVVCIIVILVAAPQAQQTTAFSPVASTGGAPPADAPTDVELLVGRSTILNVGSTITRVSLTVPDIADAMVTAPSQLLIHGKQPGTISMFVWDRSGTIKTYEVKVRRDLTALSNHMKQLFPGEQIDVRGSGKDVVVSGTVSSKYVMEKAADVAAGYVEKKENVVNLLRQQEGQASNQVMLKVRFAEVSRSALQELGVSFGAHGFKNDWFGRTTTQQFAAPEWDEEGKFVFSDFLNLFVFNAKEGLAGVVRALQNKGLFQSLAEPNLIASNGKEASFLAGGEFPYPVVQGGGGGSNNSVTIMFKEFGIRLNFTPTVIGNDLINLKVRPEVSALDFANAVVVSGFRVPALSTRRTETEVELQNGQTFAIAGLMNNTLNDSMSKIPGIGDIPILGLLFRSKAHQKNQTELVVMITPTIVRKGSSGVSEGLPSPVAPYMEAPEKTYPSPAPWVGSPRYPSNQSEPRSGGTNDPKPQSQNTVKPSAPAARPAPSAVTSTSRPPSAPNVTSSSARPSQSTATVTTVTPAPAVQPTPWPEALPSRPVTPGAFPEAAAPVAVTTPVPQPQPAPQLLTIPASSPAPQASAPQVVSAPVPMPTPAPQPVPQPAPQVVPQPQAVSAPLVPGAVPQVISAAPAPAPAPERAVQRASGRPASSVEKARQTDQARDARMAAQRQQEEERRRAQVANEQQARAAQAQAEAEAKAKRDQDKKDQEARKLAEKLDKERARRETEANKKNEEIARKRADEDEKRDKALSEAADRLKEAQTAYQSQLEKAKGGNSEKPKSQKH